MSCAIHATKAHVTQALGPNPDTVGCGKVDACLKSDALMAQSRASDES